MSLVCWLPLNGTLENKGAHKVTITNKNATIDENGKIGNCYLFDGIDNFLSLTGISFNSWPQFSFTCWCYPIDTFNCLFLIRGAGAHRIRINSGGFSFRDTNNSTLRTVALGATIPTNTWTHIACIYNHGEIYIYINGNQTAHSVSYYNSTSLFLSDLNETRIARQATTSSSTYYSGKLNDLRIYDHALSAAEVHEISQGLILNYKLDNNGYRNLFTSDASRTMTIASGNTHVYSSYTNIDPIIKANGIFKTGTPYTVTYDYVVNSLTPSTSIYIYTQLNGARCSPAKSLTEIRNGVTSGHVVETFRISADQASSTSVFRVRWRMLQGTAGDSVTITNMRLYLGREEDINYVSDCSGYNNHGTIIGNLLPRIDTARYSTSLYFDSGVNSRIVTPSLNFDSHAVTLNIWFKSTNTSPTGNYHMLVDSNENRSWYEMAVYQTGYFRGGLFVNGERKADNCSSKICLNGQWHMLTLTYDGASVRRYTDGKMEKSTTAAYTTGLSGPTALTIGREGPTATYAMKEAYLSDFRIYCTALSAEDIEILYRAGARVDNKQNLHTFEAIEDSSTIKITKKGQTKMNEVQEVSATKFYSSNNISTNNLIEF